MNKEAKTWTVQSEPISKREYFAAMAMQGLLASWTAEDYPGDLSLTTLATVATKSADALLEQLNPHPRQQKT